MAAVHTLLAFLLVNAAAEAARVCETAPPWRLNGESPMAISRGNVTVVALLQASSLTCRSQARSLSALGKRLRGDGVPVVIYGVNSHQWHSRLMGSLLRGAVEFPVYQDRADVNVWRLLGGRRDDVYVYDKCGRLTEHIPFPRSSVSQNAVEVAILRAHVHDPCASGSDDVLVEVGGKNVPSEHPNSAI